MSNNKTIKGYLSAVKAIVGSHPERAEILENVERHIHDRLAEREASAKDSGAVAAILSEMDPPEAWASAIDQEVESPGKSKLRHRFMVTSIVLSVAGVFAQFFVTKINDQYVPIWLLFLLLSVVFAVLSKNRGARWISGVCAFAGILIFLTLNTMTAG